MTRVGDVDWNDASIDHIARHGGEPEEVEEVVNGDPFVTRGRDQTYRCLGQTAAGRFLTIILVRRYRDVFAVVTARDATPKERRAVRRR